MHYGMSRVLGNAHRSAGRRSRTAGAVDTVPFSHAYPCRLSSACQVLLTDPPGTLVSSCERRGARGGSVATDRSSEG
jgi:hypothetical protein